jgi:hypothetical protein
VCSLAAREARADDDDPPPDPLPLPPPPPPVQLVQPQPAPLATKTHGWQPNRPLLVAGSAVFFAGYGTAAGAAVPSVGGLVYRTFVLIFTLGIPCWADSESSSHSYLCSADHGAIVLVLPVAGPFLFAYNHPHDTFLNPTGGELSPTARTILYTSGVVQAAGAGIVVTSFALGSDDRPPEERHGPNKSLLMTGVITFATAYGEVFLASMPSLAVGFLTVTSTSNEDKPAWYGAELAIPLAGPFIFAATHPRDIVLNPSGNELSPTARTLLYTSGAVQIAGGAMMLASLAVGSGSSSSSTKPDVSIVPLTAPGAVGLSLSISRW